jgi:hypothetical protein
MKTSVELNRPAPLEHCNCIVDVVLAPFDTALITAEPVVLLNLANPTAPYAVEAKAVENVTVKSPVLLRTTLDTPWLAVTDCALTSYRSHAFGTAG